MINLDQLALFCVHQMIHTLRYNHLNPAGVNQGILPSQYDGVVVLGVPPPMTVPRCLSLTKIHESGFQMGFYR